MKNFKNAAQLRLARRRNTKSKVKRMSLMASSNSVKPATPIKPPKVKPAQQLNALSWKPPKTSDTAKYGQLVSAAAQNRVKKNKVRKSDVIRNPDEDRGDSQDRGAGQVRIGKPPVVARKGVKWNTP